MNVVQEEQLEKQLDSFRCILDADIEVFLRKKLFKGLKKDDSYMHCILIGQLGKYLDEAFSSPISAYEMLEMAFEIIYQVKERITCSCVLVECKDHAKIRRIYEDYGFRELQKSENLVQYFKIL